MIDGKREIIILLSSATTVFLGEYLQVSIPACLPLCCTAVGQLDNTQNQLQVLSYITRSFTQPLVISYSSPQLRQF